MKKELKNFFKAYVLSNEIIKQKVKIGQYDVSIALLNQLGGLDLKIELEWDEVETINLFSEIGLFCSIVGTVSTVKIFGNAAIITMGIEIISGEQDTVDALGRSIDRIGNTLEACLMPKFGLADPNSEKSKVLREMSKEFDYFA